MHYRLLRITGTAIATFACFMTLLFVFMMISPKGQGGSSTEIACIMVVFLIGVFGVWIRWKGTTGEELNVIKREFDKAEKRSNSAL